MKNSVALITILALVAGCDRMHHIKDKTRKISSEKARRIGDKLYPQFDQDKSDTENNKQRFQDFLKVDVTEDVRDIYCFDDAIGPDADYMFAFKCNGSTSEKIILINGLRLDSGDSENAFGLQSDFSWWDKKRIAGLPRYSWTDGDRYFKYYWYDSANQQAYFFDFDL